MTVQEALERAAEHHRAGRLREAELLYRQILAEHPDHAESLHLLGVLAHQVGRSTDAVALIKRAIAISPNAGFYNNLGVALSGKDQIDQRFEAYRKALELQPDCAEARTNLAATLLEMGKLNESLAEYRRSLALAPDNADTRCGLGNVLFHLGRFDEAVAELRVALSLRPSFYEAHNTLGNIWHARGDFAQATLAHRTALSLRPDSADAHFNLGLALERDGQFDDAIDVSRKGVSLAPQRPEMHYQLGVALYKRGRLQEAGVSYRQAIAIKPDHAGAHNALGAVFNEMLMLDEAIAEYRRAIALKPDFAAAYNNLASALKDTGQIGQAIECLRKSLSVERKADVAGALLYSLHFDPHYDAGRIAEEHAEWNRTYASPLASSIRPHENDPSPERRLRIGYVALDLREHPVGRFLLPLLQNHDHSAFEIYCYCGLNRPDAVTQQLRSCADVWHSTAGLSDDALAELVRRDRIDILVDLAMHMDGTRMLTFARKPAPVQVTYLAYCSTTGLETMDYRLTDPWLDPDGVDESIYSEKSVRLPRTYWCYQPPPVAPALTPLPALANGHVTFGCLNNFGKVGPPVLAAWTKILRAARDSRLVLHSGEGSHRRRLLDQFAAGGISADRIRFTGRIGLAEYLQQYQQIDIALDPFPYPGGTTTCDALWMGVPVITLAGPTAYSRGGVSILSNVGLKEMITENPDQYVRTAIGVAQDLPRLGQLRSTLRQRMAASPLMNAPPFARDVEAVFRGMWRSWCVGTAKIALLASGN